MEAGGARPIAELLAHALDVVASGVPGELTHGFHSYPARFHPLVPRRLLEASPDAGVILDPFVGSGTTLVEAALAGRAGIGVDINPLAVALARLKATLWPAHRRAQIAAVAQHVAARAGEAARASRRADAPSAKPRRQTRYDDPRRYPPHVFRELVTLREAIDAAAGNDAELRGVLLLVLSSIVVKVSLQRSDTDETLVQRNIPRGAAARHFAAKATELAGRMGSFAVRVPAGTPAPAVSVGDARRLAHLESASVDVVITSPPYLGTYDYASHHARRFGWLGLEAPNLDRDEIGSRRGAPERWTSDVAAYVAEIARVLRPGGWAYLLVGDSAVGHTAVAGDKELKRAAVAARLSVVAWASQARPDVYAPAAGQLTAGRREHLVALRCTTATASAPRAPTKPRTTERPATVKAPGGDRATRGGGAVRAAPRDPKSGR